MVSIHLHRVQIRGGSSISSSYLYVTLLLDLDLNLHMTIIIFPVIFDISILVYFNIVFLDFIFLYYVAQNGLIFLLKLKGPGKTEC
jgi:hypothetical protein